MLLNQVLAQFAASTGSFFERIVPLDAALMVSGARRATGAAFGVRIGRSVSKRVALEFHIEHSLARLALSNSLSDAIEVSSGSFEAAFAGLLSTAPTPPSSVIVSSTVTLPDPSNAQSRIGGAVTYTVFDGNRIDAYVTGGGGIILNSGDSPEAVLTGNYTFRLFGAFPMNETDRVVVAVEQPRNSAMGLVGAGVTYDLSSRLGIRVDARLLLNSIKTATTISGSPGVIVATPTNVLPSVGSPAIQFSTLTGVRSTLSGEPTNLTTFSGSGLSRQIAVTVGVFRRF